MSRHDLPLTRHAATDISAIGWGTNCIQFKLSHKPGLASVVKSDSTITTSLLYFTSLKASYTVQLISSLSHNKLLS